MFMRKTERRKNGKTHLYWSVVESKRLGSGRVIQRHVLYLGEVQVLLLAREMGVLKMGTVALGRHEDPRQRQPAQRAVL